MPEALIKYIQHYYVNGAKTGVEGTEAPDHLNQVLTLLRARRSLISAGYRKKMLTRRIERRMSLSHFNQIADYLAFLRDHPDEVKRLFRDLLISVTSFFRDPEAFQALETEVIAPLVRAKAPDAPLRVWSARLRHRRGSLFAGHAAAGATGGGTEELPGANLRHGCR